MADPDDDDRTPRPAVTEDDEDEQEVLLRLAALADRPAAIQHHRPEDLAFQDEPQVDMGIDVGRAQDPAPANQPREIIFRTEPMEGDFPDAFESKDELVDAVQAWGKRHGVVISVKNSAKYCAILVCHRSGEYRNYHGLTAETRKRNTSSHKVGCPFRLRAAKRNGRWRVEVRETGHTHEPLDDPAGHPAFRRLTDEQRERVHQMADNGQTPLATLQELHSMPDGENILLQDVYNERLRHRTAQLAGRTSAEVLRESLIEAGMVVVSREVEVVVDGNFLGGATRLNAMLITSDGALAMAREWGKVLIIDATYKTNIFGMPLVSVVTFAPTNSSFIVASAFLSSEREDDYRWLLDTLFELLGEPGTRVIVTDRDQALMNAVDATGIPSFLCRWHILKNVTSRHKSGFTMDGTGKDAERSHVGATTTGI